MRIAAIAVNTWRETLRDRLMGAVLVFMLLAQALLFLLEGQNSTQANVLLDLAFSLMGAVGTVVAIFLGTSLMHKEIDKRTVYIVLAKPVSRFEFLAGKYLGLMATLTAMVILMSMTVAALMVALGRFNPQLFTLSISLWAQMALVTAIAFCFATMTSAVLSALYTVGLFMVGQQALLIREFADSEVRLSAFNYYVGHALFYIMPNFEVFDHKNLLIYGGQLPWGAWAWGLAYGAILSAGFLFLATLAWSERELA